MTNRINWQKRIRRADELCERNGSPQQVLGFYRHVLDTQKRIFEDLATSAPVTRSTVAFRENIDLDRATHWLPAVFETVRNHGPAKLREEATRLAVLPEKQQRQLLGDYLTRVEDNVDQASTFFARVVLQPMAEFAAAQVSVPATTSETNCPVCGSKPERAVLRPEGDGAKRHLACSFCSVEWEFRRILCPVCAEMDYAKLPRYLPEEPIAVRVEACDTCKFYLKSFDLTQDGLLLPEVDEIATIALDLWAAERGYQKIWTNVMGF